MKASELQTVFLCNKVMVGELLDVLNVETLSVSLAEQNYLLMQWSAGGLACQSRLRG